MAGTDARAMARAPIDLHDKLHDEPADVRDDGAQRSCTNSAWLLGLALLGYSFFDALLPYDATFAAAGIVALGVAHRVLSRPRFPPGTGLLTLLWATFTLGVPAEIFWTPYTETKLRALFVLAPLCVLGGLFLARSTNSRRIWVAINILFGLVMAFLTVVNPAADAAEMGRLAVSGGGSIEAGRAVGASATALTVLAMVGTKKRWPFLIVALILMALLFSIGSRGPLLGAIVSVLGAAAFSVRRGRVARTVAGIAAVSVAAYLALSANLIADRVLTVQDRSADIRRQLWAAAYELGKTHPLGIGWGRFRAEAPPGLSVGSDWRFYPHNIVVEAFAEAGWLAASVLVLTLVVAVRRQAAAALTATEMALLALLIFQIVNAMVSSDVPDNRGMWVAIGIALVAGAPQTSRRPPQAELASRTDLSGERPEHLHPLKGHRVADG